MQKSWVWRLPQSRTHWTELKISVGHYRFTDAAVVLFTSLNVSVTVVENRAFINLRACLFRLPRQGRVLMNIPPPPAVIGRWQWWSEMSVSQCVMGVWVLHCVCLPDLDARPFFSSRWRWDWEWMNKLVKCYKWLNKWTNKLFKWLNKWINV